MRLEQAIETRCPFTLTIPGTEDEYNGVDCIAANCMSWVDEGKRYTQEGPVEWGYCALIFGGADATK
jgi:hypothetical protein